MMDRLKELIGRQTYIEISGNRKYNGKIESVDESNSQIVFIDKYGETLFIAFSIIQFIQPKDTHNQSPKSNNRVMNSSYELRKESS